jgi:tetratricopeptide (TPR) repeat protein
MKVRLAALVALAIAASGTEPWNAARAPHFEVYSNASPETARSLAAGFERLHDFFARQLGVEPRTGTVRVIAFATAQEFARYRAKSTTEAFYIGVTGGDYIVMPVTSPADLRVPAHEYAHLLLHSTGWKLPLWIGEGISEVAGTIKIGDRGASAGGDLPGHSRLLRSRPWIPIADLFGGHNTDDDRFYSQSWALADLLLFSPKYAPGFPAFLAMLATGSSTESALRGVYRTTSELLAADARARLAHANPPAPAAAAGPAAASIRLEPANGAALLAGLRGTLAFQAGDRDAAIAEWRKAIDLGTDDAGLIYRYALLTEDRRALERTLALDPGRDDARYKLALMDKAAGRLESAIAQLTRIKPPTDERAFNYWITLGDTYLDLDRRADARSAFSQAATAARTDLQRKRAEELDWMASTELAVEFDGKQAHTVRVPLNTQRNPFVERDDKIHSAEATLEHVECGDDGIKVKLETAGAPLALTVPDPARVQIRNAGGAEFEFTCGPQQGRKVLVEYTAAGVLRGLELR